MRISLLLFATLLMAEDPKPATTGTAPIAIVKQPVPAEMQTDFYEALADYNGVEGQLQVRAVILNGVNARIEAFCREQGLTFNRLPDFQMGKPSKARPECVPRPSAMSKSEGIRKIPSSPTAARAAKSEEKK